MESMSRRPSERELRSSEDTQWILDDPLRRKFSILQPHTFWNEGEDQLETNYSSYSIVTEGGLFFGVQANETSYTLHSRNQQLTIPKGTYVASVHHIKTTDQGVPGQAYNIFKLIRGFDGFFERISRLDESIPYPDFICMNADERTARMAQRVGFLKSEQPNEDGMYQIAIPTAELQDNFEAARQYIIYNDQFLLRAARGKYIVDQQRTPLDHELHEKFSTLMEVAHNNHANARIRKVLIPILALGFGGFTDDFISSLYYQNYPRAVASAIVAGLIAGGVYRINKVM